MDRRVRRGCVTVQFSKEPRRRGHLNVPYGLVGTLPRAKLLRGFTLLELLIAISVSSILGAATVLMLSSSLDAYIFSEEQALAHKVLDGALEEISGEGLGNYGIKDSIEVLEAKEDSISFVPLWVDDSHSAAIKKQRFVLNRPLKSGSAIPTFEFKPKDNEDFSSLPIAFIPRKEQDEDKAEDSVYPTEPLGTGAETRIIFQPDAQYSSDVVMRLDWDAKEGRLLRTYKDKTEALPKEKYSKVRLTEVKFRYFDNTNTEIPAPVPAEELSVISAVRVNLTLETNGQLKRREASAFINLRNSQIFGKGIVIRTGMKIKIPDSRHIRTFALGNIFTAKAGDIIQLKAATPQGKSWLITIELTVKNELPIIESYSIDYPPGLTVYSETINLSCDIPFNLLTIGKSGRYDYDFDKDTDNIVDLEGDVFLTVEKMTSRGAALFIRP